MKNYKKFLLFSLGLFFSIIPETVFASNTMDLMYNDGTIIPFEEIANELNDIPKETNKFDGNYNKSRTIIGDDEREIVKDVTASPFRRLTRVMVTFPDGYSQQGSGSFIAKDTILTAGHVIYKGEHGGWPSKVTISIIDQNNFVTAKELVLPRGWIENTGGIDHDLGIIKIEESLGDRQGWFGLSQDVTNNEELTLTGYHGDNWAFMQTQTGNVNKVDTNYFSHNMDTYSGSSGSPVYNKNEQIVGVNAYGGVSSNTAINLNNNHYKFVYYSTFKDIVYGTFGTSRWTWDNETQTVTFEKGEFPTSEQGFNINTAIEKSKKLNGKKIKHINFKDEVLLAKNSSYLFSNLTSLEEISNSQYLNTSNATNMRRMFYNDSALTNLDLNSWNTSNVTDMEGIFFGNSSLSNINLNGWNTSNVTDMSSMFFDVLNLPTLNLEQWDTSSVTNMKNMFTNTTSLKELAISSWNTNSVKNMSSMFFNAQSLTNLNLNGWNTSNVTDMSSMFFRTKAMENLVVSNWNTQKVTDISSMFLETLKLQSLDITGWDLRNIEKSSSMFTNSSINSLKLGSDSILTKTYIPAISNTVYSGRWISFDKQVTYSTVDEFMQNYDGSSPGIYTRETVK